MFLLQSNRCLGRGLCLHEDSDVYPWYNSQCVQFFHLLHLLPRKSSGVSKFSEHCAVRKKTVFFYFFRDINKITCKLHTHETSSWPNLEFSWNFLFFSFEICRYFVPKKDDDDEEGGSIKKANTKTTSAPFLSMSTLFYLVSRINSRDDMQKFFCQKL